MNQPAPAVFNPDVLDHYLQIALGEAFNMGVAAAAARIIRAGLSAEKTNAILDALYVTRDGRRL